MKLEVWHIAVFCGFLFGFFLLFVSADVNENSRFYNDSDRSFLIRDFEMNDLIEIKLLTSQKNHVGVGNEVRVAEFLVELKSGSELFFDNVSFFDKNNNSFGISRNYVLKYLYEYEEEVCWLVEEWNNLTNLSLGFFEECDIREFGDWIVFDSFDDLPDGDNHVGMFVDTVLGEEIEWIPVVMGFEVPEWASYLVDGLVAYYKMDESSGSMLDELGNFNGITSGVTYNVAGKINTAYNFDGVNDYVGLGDMDFSGNNFTFSMWSKRDGIFSIVEFIFSKYQADASSGRDTKFYIDSTGTYIFAHQDGAWHVLNTGVTMNSSTDWIHVVLTIEDTNFTIYENAVIIYNTNSFAGTLSSTGNDNPRYLGSDSEGGAPSLTWDGVIDEVGFWNTALNSSAVSDLYNSGDGLSYPFEEDCWDDSVSGQIYVPTGCEYFIDGEVII